jgi:hypothetical protein
MGIPASYAVFVIRTPSFWGSARSRSRDGATRHIPRSCVATRGRARQGFWLGTRSTAKRGLGDPEQDSKCFDSGSGERAREASPSAARNHHIVAADFDVAIECVVWLTPQSDLILFFSAETIAHVRDLACGFGIDYQVMNE